MTEPNIVNNCGNCKNYAQGKACSFCTHPAQNDKSFTEYSYYNFSCNLHEPGIHSSREQQTKNPQLSKFKQVINYIKDCPHRLMVWALK